MGRATDGIEVATVRLAEFAGGPIAAGALDAPVAGDVLAAEMVVIDGWLIGREEAPVAVEIALADGVVWRAELGRARPDVAAAFPQRAGAATSGFRAELSLPRQGPLGPLAVRARFAGGDVAPFATIIPCGPDHPMLMPASARDVPTRPVTGPDFVIIGAQRGGTTSLHRYLGEHPQIVLPATKELHYFSRYYARGADWYRTQFPICLPAGTLTGEATPYYLFHPHAPRRLRAFAPDAKLIVLLRDPVDRAYSHYHHERRRGNEPLSFEAAIAAEEERLRGEVARMLADEGYDSPAHRHHGYLARGRYAEQLRAWFDVFPRERVLVLESETFYADPRGTLRQVTDILGVPPVDAEVRRAYKYNDDPYPPLAEATRLRLATHFVEPNRQLVELLGRSFSWAE